MTDLYIEGASRKIAADPLAERRTLAGESAPRPAGGLSRLSTLELGELRRSADAGSATDNAILAELYLRLYTQSAIDAKAAAILDEERRLASRPGVL